MFHDVISTTDGITIALSVIAIGLSIIFSIFTFKKTRPVERKQLQFALLLEVFRLLTSEEQQKARKAIFDMYWSVYPRGIENAAEKGKMIFKHGTPIKDNIRKVTSAFEQAGVLVIKELLSPELFFDMYAGMVCRVWYVLEEDIENDRKKNDEICKWFKELYAKAVGYYKEKNLEPPRPYPPA